jgi:hypothetical protein
VPKYGHHGKFLFLVGWIFFNFLLWKYNAQWIITLYDWCMRGSQQIFLILCRLTTNMSAIDSPWRKCFKNHPNLLNFSQPETRIAHGHHVFENGKLLFLPTSYQILVHLTQRFQRRKCFKNHPIRNKDCLLQNYK